MAVWVEAAGGLIVAGALAQATLGAVGAWRRARAERAQAEREAGLFRARADAILAAARTDAERDRLTWSGLRKFVVERTVEEAAGVRSFILRPHDGQPLPPFLPGQFLTFSLRVAGRPQPVVRCYSLSSGPEDTDHYRVTIKRLPDGVGSGWFHDTVHEGMLLDVKAPAGHFHLSGGGGPVVLIGGGIGITPILSMARHIAATGSGRDCRVFIGARSMADAVGLEELRALEAAHPNIRVALCLSRPAPDDPPPDHAGRIDIALLREVLPASNYDFYLCGPSGMMHQLVADLEAWGVPGDAIHYEAFGPASVGGGAGPAETEADTGAAPIEVVFARSGRTVSFAAGEESLLALAERHGVLLDAGCRAGNCGSCVTAVLEGKVTYRTPPGETPPPGSCLPCIARPAERLVVEA